MSKKELSCGIIITDGEYILGCLPYGRKDGLGNFDLPKGHIEEGEEPKACAIRECKEETGYDIAFPDSLVDLGQFSYIPNKDLHLFMYVEDSLPAIDDLFCLSTFELKGNEVPEVIKYKPIELLDLQHFFPSMQRTLKKALSVYETIVNG